MRQRTLEPGTTALDQRTLDDIVQRVVEVAHPEKIILFGSAARGDMNRHSDVDLLIVKDTNDTLNLTGEIYGGLRGVGIPVDVVIVSPDAVERYKDSHPLVIKPALREGRTVYESHEPSAPDDTQARMRRAQRQQAVREDRTTYDPHERYEPDDPREWVGRARSNLTQARNRTPDVYLEDLCFNAQQAAEKAIKAVMIQQDIEFPYTHHIADLLDVLRETGETIPEDVDDARSLSKYAVTTRYPGGIPVSSQEYQEALEIAEAVVHWAAARI